MNAVTFSNSEGTIIVKQLKKNARIFADAALAAQLEYPFSDARPIDKIDRVEIFDEDGNRYTDVAAFAAAFSLTPEFSEPTEAAQEVPLMEEETLDITQTFTFESLEQLRRTWRQANRVAQRELKLYVTGTITVGKQRIEKSKQWLEEALAVTDMEVERVATKWIFFVPQDTTVFAKEMSDTTFRFE